MIPAMADSQIAEKLSAWQQAGIVDAETAARIEAFEAAAPPAERTSGGITVSEVIAYIGTIVLLVGVGFLYGTEYQNLGAPGRLVLIGLVVVAGFAAGELVKRLGGTAASRRARAAGWSVGSLAATAWLAQFFVDNSILTRQPQFDFQGATPDVSGSLVLAAFIGTALAAVLLWRSGAALLAIVTGALAYTCAGTVDAYLRHAEPGWTEELTWLGAAALLIALSETVTTGAERRWAREVLRFLAVLPLLAATLIFSGPSNDQSLELFAGAIAVAGFGLALVRSSAGYAIAAGIGLFIFVNEVGFRHFSNTLGFPVVLIISGIALFAIAAGLVGVLRRLRPRS
jgi:hypothetical protein